MSCRKDHQRVESDFLLNFFREITDHRTRHGQLCEEFLRKSQPPDQIHIPGLCRRVYQVRAGRVGVLLLFDPCQQIAEIVRDHEHGVRLPELFRMLFL